MDFIDTIFSFIPLIMIFLFITRIAKSAGKKNRPKPINTIEKSEKQKPQKAQPQKPSRKPKFDRVAFAHDFIEQLKSVIQEDEDNPKPATVPLSSSPVPGGPGPGGPGPGSPVNPAPVKPVAKAKTAAGIKHRSAAENKRLVLSKQKADAVQKESARSRLNSLPELKKAVVWAEILGPPKGLQ